MVDELGPKSKGGLPSRESLVPIFRSPRDSHPTLIDDPEHRNAGCRAFGLDRPGRTES